MAEDFARWAVESWALALQMVTSADIREENRGQAAPGLTPLPHPTRGVVQIPCPACGRMLRVAENLAGRQLPCPACKVNLKLSADGRELELAASKDTAAKRTTTPWTGKEIAVDLGSGVKLEMVWIPAGEFRMGSPTSDKEAQRWEKPQHGVWITRPFYLGKYPVTQEQWQAVMGSNPAFYSPDGGGKLQVAGKHTTRLPVESVSWNDAVEFCRRLSENDGKKYGLPTEAQWEYACRAGSTTRYCFGDDVDPLNDFGYYSENSAHRTRPVGEKKPNAWGLCDMHGGVMEWCSDWFGRDYYADSPPDDPTGPGAHSRVNTCGFYRRDRVFQVAFPLEFSRVGIR